VKIKKILTNTLSLLSHRLTVNASNEGYYIKGSWEQVMFLLFKATGLASVTVGAGDVYVV
jgi:hypothetical protein